MACTILIVDDSKFSRGRIRSALQPMVCTLLEAADGQEALNYVEAHSLDLIITDLLMPHLDGFGLLRGLRDQGVTVPVIVASADVQSSSRRLCEELGVSLFLEKPFAPQNLLSAVQSVLSPALLVS